MKNKKTQKDEILTASKNEASGWRRLRQMRSSRGKAPLRMTD